MSESGVSHVTDSSVTGVHRTNVGSIHYICILNDKVVANANRTLLCGTQDSYPGEGEIHCRLLQMNLSCPELKHPEQR